MSFKTLSVITQIENQIQSSKENLLSRKHQRLRTANFEKISQNLQRTRVLHCSKQWALNLQ